MARKIGWPLPTLSTLNKLLLSQAKLSLSQAKLLLSQHGDKRGSEASLGKWNEVSMYGEEALAVEELEREPSLYAGPIPENDQQYPKRQ